MKTELGSYLRELRAQHGELLKDMADRLSMSPAMLSSVENGKRNVSKDFTAKLTAEYKLDTAEQGKLALAIAKTKEEVALNLRGLSQTDQDLAVSFARRFPQLHAEDKARIKQILEGGDGSR